MNFGSVGFIAWLSAGSELVVVYTASDNQQHRGAALLCRRGGTARTRAILTCVASLCPCDASAFRCSVSLCCWGGGQLQEDRIDNRQRRACLRVALLCRRGGTARARAMYLGQSLILGQVHHYPPIFGLDLGTCISLILGQGLAATLDS